MADSDGGAVETPLRLLESGRKVDDRELPRLYGYPEQLDGIWVRANFITSVDGGAHFTASPTGLPALADYQFGSASAQAVPGIEGDVWLTNFKELNHSTDSGKTYESIPSVSEAYALGFGSLLLLGGLIADIIGRKMALIIGLIGFAGASAVGGVSTSFFMLEPPQD